MDSHHSRIIQADKLRDLLLESKAVSVLHLQVRQEMT